MWLKFDRAEVKYRLTTVYIYWWFGLGCVKENTNAQPWSNDDYGSSKTVNVQHEIKHTELVNNNRHNGVNVCVSDGGPSTDAEEVMLSSQSSTVNDNSQSVQTPHQGGVNIHIILLKMPV